MPRRDIVDTCKNIGIIGLLVVSCPLWTICIIIGYPIAYLIKHSKQRRHRRERARWFWEPPQLLTDEEKEALYLKRREASRPKALPKTRLRALTLPLPVFVPDPEPPMRASKREKLVQQVTIDQLESCTLFKLPLELRTIIWTYTLGGNHIHILKKRRRLGNTYCPSEDAEQVGRRDMCVLSKDERGFCRSTAYPEKAWPLALISSCRQIYSEAINILYSTNTFAFDDIDALLWFGSTVLPQRLSLVTSLHFDWVFLRSFLTRTEARPPNDKPTWENACEVLASMTKLRNLKVNIKMQSSYGPPQFNPLYPEFLDPLCSVHVNGNFEVYVPWPEDHLMEIQTVPRDAPFQIRRLPAKSPVNRVDFVIPFTVQCLHCQDYTTIKKGVEGYADQMQSEDETAVILWTFHTFCGGWIEFTLDKWNGQYSVTQGATRVPEQDLSLPGLDKREDRRLLPER
ncbi:hypothetical protein K432DRAFT_439645 [Lepidopterella palustris CBS 459.81]|uniref:DUF7730 domain-containing protein n=1 Tax=Lepidopterella palustris CBS 459.81 TaxID=1314670 RepID=A0A8E2EJ31_9PEZI|nr:hypothetical protein K432DRAFT_439645 [Lepidopterella palustris CBS 459.81]